MIKGDKDGMIAYGDRSNYVTSVRIAHRAAAFARHFRADVSYGDAASGFGRA